MPDQQTKASKLKVTLKILGIELRREFLAVGLLVLLIAVSIWFAMASPYWGDRVNFGFGAEWSCKNIGYLEPICSKIRK